MPESTEAFGFYDWDLGSADSQNLFKYPEIKHKPCGYDYNNF